MHLPAVIIEPNDSSFILTELILNTEAYLEPSRTLQWNVLRK